MTQNLVNEDKTIAVIKCLCNMRQELCTVKPVLRGHDLWDKERVAL